MTQNLDARIFAIADDRRRALHLTWRMFEMRFWVGIHPKNRRDLCGNAPHWLLFNMQAAPGDEGEVIRLALRWDCALPKDDIFIFDSRTEDILTVPIADGIASFSPGPAPEATGDA